MRSRQTVHIAPFLVVAGVLFSGIADALDDFDAPPISYSTAPAVNPVSRLQDALDSNAATLAYDPQFGYLKSLLALLNIPQESQTLVFSKTSLQVQYISPNNPRSIYFNDDAYVGRVPGGKLLEISVADPVLGAVFYTLEQHQVDHPQFIRQTGNCLQCHGSVLTSGVPGHIVRSVYTNEDGYPLLKAGSFVSTDASPWRERWGGWYVTGTHGAARHMGNTIAHETDSDVVLDFESGANRATLDPRVEPAEYLTPHSDIVALLVLEHQTRMHNLFTEASFETRQALARQTAVNEALKRDPATPSETTQHIIQSIGNKLVDYMLFVGEAPLEAPVAGTSGFTTQFPKSGPRDAKGRSLRDFDLQTRLFQFPLSYLIYSPQFDGLPAEMKDYVYQRLWNILSGVTFSKEYLHLTKATRQAITEILVETKPGLPAYYHQQ